MTTTTEPTAEPRPYRQAYAWLKQDIKNDIPFLREQKRNLRIAQRERHPIADAEQASLAKNRRYARARFIVYGLARGHAWERMERNHAEGDESLKALMTAIWLGVQKRLEAPVEPPALLAPWLLR